MARIRVVSTVGGSESDRAVAVLKRWVAHYIGRRNRQSTKTTTTPDVLIESTHTRQLLAREKAFEQRMSFSWTRFFVGLMSLILVFSDVFRGGLGVHKLEKYYPALHPDEVLGFGTSWNYSVFAATKDEAYSDNLTTNVWTYKFDSTSITWRAFAKYLEVAQYPDCFFYTEQCPGETFDGDVAFRMIDGVVNAVANMNNTRKERIPSRGGPVGLTLRTENEYIDRLHQFLLPKWFTNFNWRTNQALHYSPHLLERSGARGICFPANGGQVRTPHFCQELWTNLDRSCDPTDLVSRSAGLLYVHTMGRLRDIQARFPNTSVDLTFLESQEDLQVCRGGLSMTGFRRSDVSTIIRARNCIRGRDTCDTVFLEDYRYETGLLISDVVQWYRLVASLRSFGQVYFWLRGIGLVLSCYFVFGRLNNHKKRKVTIRMRLRRARNLFMKVPTQCVVYGSSFPILCYVFAHLLDAPFTYNVLEGHFFSQAGIFSIQPEAFVSYAVVQMRSVWIYTMGWHVVVRVYTSRGSGANNLNKGITGVPEFLLSAFASVTLIAQYRSTSFRSAKILKISELPSTVGRGWETIKYQYDYVHRGRGSVLLGGVVIDLKFLVCLLFLVAAGGAVLVLGQYYWSHRHNQGRHTNAHWFVLPPTPVPYSIGVLLSPVSVCVQWSSDYYCIRDERHLGQQMRPAVQEKQYGNHHTIRSRLLVWKQNVNARVLATTTSVRSKYVPEAEQQQQHARLVKKHTDQYRYIQHHLKCLHRRADDAEANVAFINTVLMSDPLVFLNLRLGNWPSTQLAYFQSIWHPQQILLLPVAVVGELNEYTDGLQLLRLVKASELSWSELVQCG